MAYMTDENGNYKRTVRCGHCYMVGHNKSACPDRKIELKANVDRYTKELAANSFAHDYQKTNVERYLAHNKQQIHDMETRGQNRKCGFCSSPGHTRRTCTDRKTETEIQTRQTIELRKKAAERMVAAGFGPGALVETDCHYTDTPVLAIVTKIRMTAVLPQHKVLVDGHFRPCEAVDVRYVTPVKSDWSEEVVEYGSAKIPLDFMNIEDHNKSKWYNAPNVAVRVISPVDIKTIQLLPASSIDDEAVKKMVLDEIVDPR